VICLRCGYCCINTAAVIVDNPDLGPIEGNLISRGDAGEPCKHLLGDIVGEYECSIHEELWYKETPCFSHGQIERENSPCRMGTFLLKKGE
jgi:hypothetical protein